MANQKLTDRNLMNEQLHDDDVIHIVDVSDTTDSPEGTSKKWKILTWLKTLFEDKSNKKTTLSENSDTYYPTQKAVKTAVDGKVNLDQSTQQTILNDSPLFSEGVDMANDKWLKSKDYAGTGYLNILKGNEDNEVDVGTQLNVGSIEAEEDAGAITLFDMPVSSASADGTEMSATIKIDGNNILKIYAESDGAGGADTFKVQLLNKAVLTMQDSAGTTHTYTADTDGSLIIS